MMQKDKEYTNEGIRPSVVKINATCDQLNIQIITVNKSRSVKNAINGPKEMFYFSNNSYKKKKKKTNKVIFLPFLFQRRVVNKLKKKVIFFFIKKK